MSSLEQDVLVLNSDYEPVNICNLKRAICLIYLGKVDVLHTDSVTLHSRSTVVEGPSVIRLRYHIRRPMPRLRLSRRSVFARDNYTCQYCGVEGGDLTMDHVVPKRLGGRTEWDNLVCCCRRCNTKKGDKTVEQLGFRLAREPKRPRWVPFVSLVKYMDGKKNEVWRDYLPHVGGWTGREQIRPE